MADCTPQRFEFQGLGKRRVVADFGGGRISSDGGALLLGALDRQAGLVSRFAACFRDRRRPDRIEHSVEELVRQRVFGLVLGYDGLSEHDTLRKDALLATAVGKADVTGASRTRASDRGKALAGKSTLNRLERAPRESAQGGRYRRIEVDAEAIDRFFVEAFLATKPEGPEQIILDLDATDIELHGNQEGRFFHAYYGCYCYLPLYIFCGDSLLVARLRKANQDASAGSVDELAKLVPQIRARWPGTRILVRADSGFCREDLMAWCESNHVHYVLGLARNSRLEKALKPTFEPLRAAGAPGRAFAEWQYRTRKSWSRQRRVIGKAEITEKGDNPRFLVTSLPQSEVDAKTLYETIYCARGEMENRIKEQQLDLFADHTPADLMQVNQMRIWLAGLAYTLVCELRRLALAGTELARARASTLRLKLLKVGALVEVTTRRIWVRFATGFPYQDLFDHARKQLQRAGPPAAA
jgi:Transposase DDE domain group 1